MKKVIIFVVILIFLACGVVIGKRGFGLGDGSKEGNQVLVASETDKIDADSQNQEIIIRVGEEECDDAKDLADKISKISSQQKETEYIFEHEHAIKATYDEVMQTLNNLEETLEIKIDYRRNERWKARRFGRLILFL